MMPASRSTFWWWEKVDLLIFSPASSWSRVHGGAGGEASLDPDYPRGTTVPALDMLTGKLGLSRAEAEGIEARMAETAAAEGLPFGTHRLHGNTFDVHRLLQLAKDRGLQLEALGRFYRALWAEERSLFDPESLVLPAVEAGLDEQEVRRALAGDDYAEAVRADEAEARALGISGVPFYVIDGRYGVSGAQPAQAFTGALEQAWAAAAASHEA